MIRVVMADEHIDMTVAFEVFFRKTISRRQLLIFSKPVIKDQNGIITGNGKAAVIVMRYEITLQNILHPFFNGFR